MALARRGKVLLLALSALLLASLGFVWRYRGELRLEWRRRQARSDCLAPGFDRTKPTPAWREVLESGEEGFRQLALLLRDPENAVWQMAVESIDFELKREARSRFLAYLRARDPCALVLYLIEGPYKRQAPGESFYRGEEDAETSFREGGDVFGREYWTGRNSVALAPAREALRFLEEALLERPRSPGEEEPRRAFQYRAVNALAAMAEAEDVTRLLARTALLHDDPEVQLHAAAALVVRSGTGGSFPELWEWEKFSLDGLGGEEGPRVFHEPGSLQALVHLDHPRVLPVLARLDRRPEMREFLGEVLSQDGGLPVPLPRWRPLREAAERFLKGSLEERALAAVSLLELPPAEGRVALERQLPLEGDPELKLFIRAALLVLGDESQRGPVRAGFDTRFKRGLPRPPPGTTVLLGGNYGDWMQMRESAASSSAPFTATPWTREPYPASCGALPPTRGASSGRGGWLTRTACAGTP